STSGWGRADLPGRGQAPAACPVIGADPFQEGRTASSAPDVTPACRQAGVTSGCCTPARAAGQMLRASVPIVTSAARFGKSPHNRYTAVDYGQFP
ncbi:MAG: hypothetical protein KA259_02075, partial [Caldilineaceae bacterium]|nr:hypothetical protein [Caldilineaceae bacterium]